MHYFSLTAELLARQEGSSSQQVLFFPEREQSSSNSCLLLYSCCCSLSAVTVYPGRCIWYTVVDWGDWGCTARKKCAIFSEFVVQRLYTGILYIYTVYHSHEKKSRFDLRRTEEKELKQLLYVASYYSTTYAHHHVRCKTFNFVLLLHITESLYTYINTTSRLPCTHVETDDSEGSVCFLFPSPF